ncbi:MAG: biotin--[acetyl-CoA-carboxylase] ligase [Bacteroidetes bacterium]|nr:biotin--[acetyl-CoA-carboxylase] ligase [Bacteroidota bacterium]
MISLGKTLKILPRVDSTNNYAMDLARTGQARHGDGYFALEQTAGKGQRGKTWEAEPGANIMLSLVAEPQWLSIARQFHLSAAIALGCYDFFKTLAGSETSIKWPNDIYWRDRKAGGILIENLLSGDVWQYAIVGIGININQGSFPEGLLNPVSLRQITGRSWEVQELVKELCRCLQARYEQLEQTKDFPADYNRVLYKRGQLVRLRKENRVFDALLKEVAETGELLVEAGTEERFGFGEIQFVF